MSEAGLPATRPAAGPPAAREAPGEASAAASVPAPAPVRPTPAARPDARAASRRTSAEKAAILITALGPDAAGRILGAMTEAHIRRFARAVSRLERIPPDLLEATIADFLDELGDDAAIRGGADQARSLIGQVLDDASVARIMDDMRLGAGSLWAELAACPDDALAGLLQAEHPQTAAVILSELRTDKAARVLENMDPALAQVVVLRLARTPRVERAVMELLQSEIARGFLATLRRERSARKPADVIGGLLNNVSETVRGRFLETIEAEKPEFAQEVQRVMFTFADIASRVEPRDVSTVVRSVEEETLLIALKAGRESHPNAVEFILGNVSKRLSERYVEDLDAMGEVKRRAGETAQMAVVQAVQGLAQAGEIKLIESEAPEE